MSADKPRFLVLTVTMLLTLSLVVACIRGQKKHSAGSEDSLSELDTCTSDDCSGSSVTNDPGQKPQGHSSRVEGWQNQGFLSFEDFKKWLGEEASPIYDSEGDVVGAVVPGDPDQCCQTVPHYYANSTLTNIAGKQRTIAQGPQVGDYQIIRHGFCGTTGNQCLGSCVEQFVEVSLAIYPPVNNQIVSFELFRIPGYCSCQATP